MSRTLLIVEDDVALRGGMNLLLSKTGHSVVTAANLAEARDRLRTDVPSHAIIDLNLPDGLGTELLREMRERGLPTKVMIVTGSADTSLAEQVAGLGADGVLRKPPDWSWLLRWASTPAAEG